ncbi:MAG: hypothetical protein R3D26_18590 [Cyanobacteriota/Melainabacteria group bacterium]
MSRVVAKGNYIKGKIGVSKAHAHLKYIEHRPGRDKDQERRQFFSETRDQVSSAEIRERIDDQDRRQVVMHRIVLSPGHNRTDLKEFTRETMEELSDRKGQKLEWYAIDHRNTDHSHIHVCVMGKDRDGELVKLNSNDYRAIRATGDLYMDRNHGLDRYLESEGRRVVDSREYKSLDRKWLDEELKRFEYGNGKDRERSERALKDRMDWEQLDKDLKKSFNSERGEINRMTGKQFQTEMAGRHLEHHERAQLHLARERWEIIRADHPEMADQVAAELKELDKAEEAFRAEIHQKTSFDKLMRDIDYAQEAERIDYQYLFREGPIYDRLDELAADKNTERDTERDDEPKRNDKELEPQHDLSSDHDRAQEPELEDLFEPLDENKNRQDHKELEVECAPDKDLEPELEDLFEPPAEDNIEREAERDTESDLIADIGPQGDDAIPDVEAQIEIQADFDISGEMESEAGGDGDGDRSDDSGY